MTTSEHLNGAVFRIAIVTGLTTASLDLLLTVVVRGRGSAWPQYMGVGLSAAAVVLTLLYLLLWFAIVAPLARRRAWDGIGVAIGLGHGLAAAFSVSLLTGIVTSIIRLDFDLHNRVWMLAGFPLFAGLIAMVGAYTLYRTFSERKTWQTILAATYISAGPVLATAALLLWARSSNRMPVTLTPLMEIGVLLGMGVFLIACTYLALQKEFRWTVISFLVFGMVIAPWGALWRIHYVKAAPSTVTEASPQHVVYIVMDTLRADALSAYGSERVQTPNIDALAADGVLFENALAPAPWTLPSVTSMMTGMSPLVHQATNRFSVVPRKLKMAGEYFYEAGYRTGVVGMSVVLGEINGMDRGFESVEWHPKRILLGSLGGEILDRISVKHFGEESFTEDLVTSAMDFSSAHSEEPSFLWLHIFDPHERYAPDPRFIPEEKLKNFKRGLVYEDDMTDDIRKGTVPVDDALIDWMHTLYEAEVRYVDEEIGRFVAHLKKLGVYDDALIVLTSDHGEEFWEHGDVSHGQSLYTEMIHVPLLIKLPGNTAKGRQTARVCTQDIVPTLLDVCGIPYEPEFFSGRSLRGHWEGEDIEDQTVYAAGMLYYQQKEALIYDNMKYIRNLVNDREELYDLEHDPEELHSLIETDLEAVAEAYVRMQPIRDEADALREHFGLPKNPVAPAPNPDLIEQLESMGYL